MKQAPSPWEGNSENVERKEPAMIRRQVLVYGMNISCGGGFTLPKRRLFGGFVLTAPGGEGKDSR